MAMDGDPQQPCSCATISVHPIRPQQSAQRTTCQPGKNQR